MTPDTSYTITDAQQASFDRDGFLLLDDVLTTSQVSDLQAWTAEVKAWPNRQGEHMPYEEIRADGTTGLCRTENYANYHSGFGGLFRGERLIGILTDLMGEQAVLFKEKINYKEAGGSGGFDAHIDATAYNHAGAVNHQTFLMAVNDMDMKNGCLEVVPGSHKQQIPLGANKCIDPVWESKQTWVPVPMSAGAILVFGSYLAHRSGPNSSQKPRAAIYATYNGISEGDKHDSYYAHRRRAWPPTFEREAGKDYSEGALTSIHNLSNMQDELLILDAFGSPMTGGKTAIDASIAKQKKTVDDLFDIIKAQGDADYIGEAISQLDHCLQAAASASKSGADEPTVIAALLHDIGQFLPQSTTEDMMHNGQSVGKRSHDATGEAYLRGLGFPDKVCKLVGAHVVAKKYLTATEPGYYEALSQASKTSLKYQGGPFTDDEVIEFKKDPLWKGKVALRRWDDAAKVVDLEVPDLDSYRLMAIRVLGSS